MYFRYLRQAFLCFIDQDGAEPSGNSVSCHNLQRLAAYADKSAAPEGGACKREKAKGVLKAFAKRLVETPTSLPEMMSALMFYTDSPTQVRGNLTRKYVLVIMLIANR